jgi:replicative superfamily II helicase
LAFHGLFIGIDRFASADVNELTCAARDATALYALFADTLGNDSAVLLTDEAATRDTILGQFETRLAAASSEDIVVISFSGHGSDDQYLVTHDADVSDFASTCIALDDLVTLFSRIPAKTVILILDCCFSGGAGARVFRHGMPTRSIRSPEQALASIANEGRLILTASDPNQEAIEDPATGHGLLTWFLLQALRGAPEVVAGGRVHFYRLLSFVTQRVTDEAATFGHEQRPTFRGTVDGELLLPVFVPGAEFARRFPERALPPVTENVTDLVAHGLPAFVLEAWKTSAPTLNELQRAAVNDHGVLAARSVVVSAPTSSGKTMIGELAALRGFADRRRALFLLPMRAIVNDKYDEFSDKYGPLGLRILRATGERQDDVPNILRGRYDLCLMTYEKASALLLGHPHVLRGVGTVIVDEVQMLADPSRGANLEFLLTLLKYRRREGVRPQLVLLSAVIGDTNGLERWLTASLLKSEKRPVPLREGVLRADGSFRYFDDTGTESAEACVRPEYRKGTAQDLIVPLVRKLVASGESVIVFRESKSETRSVAAYLCPELGLPAAINAINQLPSGDPSTSSAELRECMRRGVAFHNADLDREERQVIERAFRDRDGVRVLVATTTLAMGVNTPASSVVIRGLQHPGGDEYTVAEYKNMSGRAGRYGFTEAGKSFLVCTSAAEEWKLWNGYVRGKPEALRSRFLGTDPLLLVLRVLATADESKVSSMTEEQVIGFLESSFGAYQLLQRAGAGSSAFRGSTFKAAFARLLQHGLIAAHGGGYRLTDLGRVAGEAGLAIESVLRIAGAVQGLAAEALTGPLMLALVQLTVELDDVRLPTHKKSHKERNRWEQALREHVPSFPVLGAVLRGDEAVARAKRSLPHTCPSRCHGSLHRTGPESDRTIQRRRRNASSRSWTLRTHSTAPGNHYQASGFVAAISSATWVEPTRSLSVNPLG